MENNNYLKPISDEEIEYAERILLRSGEDFDDEERRKIIRLMESASVEACPGSGKTTVLLAKLIILANRFPFSNGKGICVLTHTNVAIDEIKERLGEKSESLFKYPNFFGTLQSFIDRYLAIPCYKEKFNKNITMIDDEIVNRRYEYLSMKNEKYLNANFVPDKIYYKFSDKKFYSGKKVLFSDPDKFLYKECKGIIKNGFLRFNEALELGKIYIEKYPMLKNIFSSRFAFVFVDEMQDTSQDAYDILERLFDKEKSIVQYIGDSNQDILNGCCNWTFDKIYSITESKRYGSKIADIICPLRVINKEGNKLKGNRVIMSELPHIILFDTHNEYMVLDKFVELIKEKKLINVEKPIFKAIGFVAKEDVKGKSIVSYYKNYFGKSSSERGSFQYLEAKAKRKKTENRELMKIIIKICSNFLNFEKISIENNMINRSNFSERLKEMKLEQDFKYNIYRYVICKEYFMEMKDNIYNILMLCFNIKKNCRERFDEYFKLDKKETSNKNEENIFEKDGIKVFIDTVHGVKGETHTATLYLETHNYEEDLSAIKELIFSKTKNCGSGVRIEKKRKIAFVGFSRPQYLLCLAMEKTDDLMLLIEQNREYLKNKIEIVEL